MARKRQTLPVDVRKLVLHEGGYKCGNPVCRMVLTLDIHHLLPLEEDGPDTADNLLALCPNCHSLHHKGVIPRESLRSWKLLLLSLNQGFDQRSVDILLSLDIIGTVVVSGDALIGCCASLIAAGLVSRGGGIQSLNNRDFGSAWEIHLTDRGRYFVSAWKKGDQQSAVQGKP